MTEEVSQQIKKLMNQIEIVKCKLQAAIAEGYVEDFSMNAFGQLYCLSQPTKLYNMETATITFEQDDYHKCTVYLIATNDGLLGTLIEYHDC